MSVFENEWYFNCPIHKKERFLFFRSCWKCDILKYAKSMK